MNTIGQRIRAALTHLDKTPKWLAAEVGVSYETVRKWLSDEIAPKRGRVAAVAAALGLPEENLMFGTAPGAAAAPAEPPTAAPQEPASAWPFSAPRADFDKLSSEDRASLDAVVTKFMAGCLADQPVFARKKVITFTGLHPQATADSRKAK